MQSFLVLSAVVALASAAPLHGELEPRDGARSGEISKENKQLEVAKIVTHHSKRKLEAANVKEKEVEYEDERTYDQQSKGAETIALFAMKVRPSPAQDSSLFHRMLVLPFGIEFI